MGAKKPIVFAVPNATLNRHTLPEMLRDIKALPAVDPNSFSGNSDREARYQRNLEAYRLYVSTNTPISEIQSLTGINTTQIRRLIQRVVSTHEDGLIQGLRGLIPDARVKAYRRKATVEASTEDDDNNPAGAWRQLLESVPILKTWLDKEIKKRNAPLKKEEIREVRPIARMIHSNFLKQCKLLGISDSQYPFNQNYRGLRSLQQYIKNIEAEQFSHTVIRGKSVRHGGIWSDEDSFFDIAATQPFSVVQFDGHKIDVRLTISVVDPFGMETIYEISRIWILAFSDKLTKASLGYSLSLGENYSASDFAQALINSIEGQPQVDLTIPKLKLSAGGGFPSKIIPHLSYQRWGWVHFDEAKAHTAQETLDRMVRTLGTWTATGRLGHANDRSFQERFFGILETAGFRRIPGSVGSSPEDSVRVLADVGNDISRLIRLDLLEQIVYVLMANLNAETQGGLGGRSAIEAMNYFTAKPTFRNEPIPITRRGEVFLMRKEVVLTIRGRPGELMHVNYKEVRYSSKVLSTRHELEGHKLRCYVIEKNICQIRAFFEDGTELGMLVASRQWARTPHSLRTRKEINRLIKLGKLRVGDSDDVVAAYIAMKKTEAATNKRSASRAAAAHREAAIPKQHPLKSEIEQEQHNISDPANDIQGSVTEDAQSNEPIEKKSIKPTPMKIRSTIIL